jgi:hypothetical protein
LFYQLELFRRSIATKKTITRIHLHDSTKQVGRVTGYTVDAIYLDGKDTVTVTGLTQAQYDSLQIAE